MKMLRLHTIFAIIAVCGMFFSCEDTSDPVIIIPPYGEEPDFTQYYPMEYWNYWSYTETTFTPSVISVKNYTTTICGYRSDSTGNWWKFQTTPDSNRSRYRELMQRNDTVFDYQWGWGGPFANERYIIPPLNDTITYVSLLGGDIGYHVNAYHYPGLFNTPMGLFGNCDVFQTNFNHDGTQRRYEIIARGVGLVGIDYYSEDYHSKVRLTDFHLNIKGYN